MVASNLNEVGKRGCLVIHATKLSKRSFVRSKIEFDFGAFRTGLEGGGVFGQGGLIALLSLAQAPIRKQTAACYGAHRERGKCDER